MQLDDLQIKAFVNHEAAKKKLKMKIELRETFSKCLTTFAN